MSIIELKHNNSIQRIFNHRVIIIEELLYVFQL